MNRRILSFFTVFAVFIANAFTLSVPSLTGRVVDNANLLSANEKETVSNYLESLENTTGIQIAVLTVPSLEDEALEDYTMKVCESWKLGQKGKDNGALLFIALNDRKIRIEVGYGLEEKLTATKCGLIIRNIIKPAFTKGNYAEGIKEATSTMGGIASDNAELISAKMNKKSSTGVSSVLKGLLGMFIWFVFCSCLASGKKNHFLPWIIFSSAYRSSHRGNYNSSFRSSSGFGGSDTFGGHDSFGGGGFGGGGGGFGGGGASGGW